MEVLPDHLLLKIFEKLRFEDLRIVSVVNSRLYRISLDPLLWARFLVSSDRILSNIQEFTSIRRFKKLRRLEISALRRRVLKPEDISTLFSYLSSNTNIQYIRFSNLDLSSVPGFPFSQALVSVSSLSLQGCDLTTEQCIALLSVIVKSGRPRILLDLSSNCLQHVSSQLLGEVTRLSRTLNLSLTDLTTTQSTEILSAVQSNPGETEELELSDLNLETINPTLISESITCLKSVNLSNALLSDEGKETLFFALCSSESNLTETLDLSCMSLSCLDPVLLSEGLRKICRIHLRNCWLTTLQIWEILDSLYESSTEELNLSGNDCSEITSSQLFAALNHLRVLNLTAAKVGTDTLLQVMSEPNLVQRGRIVFSSSDFPSKNIQSRLNSVSWIELRREDLPYYQDETSCGYGVEEDAIQT